MKRWLAILVLSLSLHVQANDHKYIFDTPQNGLVKFLDHGKNRYIITSNRLYRITKRTLELKATFTFTCNDACISEDGIALATDSGLISYSLKYGRLKKLLPEKVEKKVNQVLQDAHNRLWFSHPYEGAYVINNGQLHLKVQAPVIYDMVATPDSNVWVGTNLGLYKVPLSGDAIFRYAEESRASLELPDNIVERLFADDASNVWALLPDQMALIPGKKTDGHIPSYAYPGTAENKIFSITKLPLSSHAFLFSTLQGLLYTKNLHGIENTHPHSGEIHQMYRETAHAIPDALTERPLEFGQDPVVSICSKNEFTWFVTNKGVWNIKTKKFLKQLQAIQ